MHRKIQYVYDYRNNQKRPVACIVKVNNNIGISICPKYLKFNKQKAVEIATGRANTVGLHGSLAKIPKRKITSIDFDSWYKEPVEYRITLRSAIMEKIDECPSIEQGNRNFSSFS